MDNLETLVTLGIPDTERRQHNQKQKNTTQKSKKMANTDPTDKNINTRTCPFMSVMKRNNKKIFVKFTKVKCFLYSLEILGLQSFWPF